MDVAWRLLNFWEKISQNDLYDIFRKVRQKVLLTFLFHRQLIRGTLVMRVVLRPERNTMDETHLCFHSLITDPLIQKPSVLIPMEEGWKHLVMRVVSKTDRVPAHSRGRRPLEQLPPLAVPTFNLEKSLSVINMKSNTGWVFLTAPPPPPRGAE